MGRGWTIQMEIDCVEDFQMQFAVIAHCLPSVALIKALNQPSQPGFLLAVFGNSELIKAK